MGGVRLFKASAGSGKTFRLAYEYILSIIRDPMQYRHILAVTFTNKATEEMKHRIISELDQLARGRETEYFSMLLADLKLRPEAIREKALRARTFILHDYSRFAILTIDKFFQRILRSFIKELGIDLNFNLELQTESLLSEASDRLIDSMSVNDELRKWVTSFVEERIEENKSWDISSGLKELGTELFRETYRKLSSASVSKKELETLARRMSSRSREIADSASGEASRALSIIGEAGLSLSDFSGGQRTFANYFKKVAESGSLPAYGASIVSALESDEKWYAKNSPRKEEILALIPRLKPILQSICDLYDREHRFIKTSELVSRNYRNFAMLADLHDKVREICQTENILPIAETTDLINRLVSGNDTPFIFEKAGNYFTRFMIDEFQDTSGRQWENFLPLLRNSLAQSPDSPVMLVGDVKQSIYRWRGGDWRILSDGIDKEFGEVNEEVLERNYRSSANIVRFNNNLISAFVAAVGGGLDAELLGAKENGLVPETLVEELMGTIQHAYEGHLQVPARKEDDGYVDITYYRTDDENENPIPAVILKIEELQEKGYRPGEIAVLVRYNAEGAKIADMMLEYKRCHPGSKYSYDVVTQEALAIGNSDVVNFIAACLRLSFNMQDKLSLAVYNRWAGREVYCPLPGEERERLAALALLSPSEAFEELVRLHALNSNRDNTAYLQAFHDQLLTFQRTRIGDIALFLKWWDETGCRQSVRVPVNDNSIIISSIHKAKGLEYPAVVIPYCDWPLGPNNKTIVWTPEETAQVDFKGGLPLYYSEKMRESHFAESYYREKVMSYVDNSNTLYVAVTRAVRELHIMIPDDKKGRGDRVSSVIGGLINESGENRTALIGEIEMRKEEFDAGYRYRFGKTPPMVKKNVQVDNNGQLEFRSADTKDRLRLRFNSSRYYEDGNVGGGLSPRGKGILLHKVFEGAQTLDDAYNRVTELVATGEISNEEAVLIRDNIREISGNPLVSSWFDPECDLVKNETDIIIPGETSVRRPDRVVIKCSKATAVDYKFGLKRSATHIRQMREYMGLLEEMGYGEVEGYIWYISLGDIEKVG